MNLFMKGVFLIRKTLFWSGLLTLLKNQLEQNTDPNQYSFTFNKGSDKGYWVYDDTIGDTMDYFPPKNVHFLTATMNNDEQAVKIIISKQAINLSSQKYDYLWDLEYDLAFTMPIYIKKGYQIIDKLSK